MQEFKAPRSGRRTQHICLKTLITISIIAIIIIVEIIIIVIIMMQKGIRQAAAIIPDYCPASRGHYNTIDSEFPRTLRFLRRSTPPFALSCYGISYYVVLYCSVWYLFMSQDSVLCYVATYYYNKLWYVVLHYSVLCLYIYIYRERERESETYVCIYIYIPIHICMHTDTYIHIACVYIYIYIYIYIWPSRASAHCAT